MPCLDAENLFPGRRINAVLNDGKKKVSTGLNADGDKDKRKRKKKKRQGRATKLEKFPILRLVADCMLPPEKGKSNRLLEINLWQAKTIQQELAGTDV